MYNELANILAYSILNRGGNLYYVRRVPAHLKPYDSRQQIRVALKTKDPATAKARAVVQNEGLEKYWAGLVKHKKVHGADEKWHDAVALARANGFTYRTVEQLAEDADTEELVARLATVKKKGVEPRLAAALLGGAGKPVIRYSTAVHAYFDLTQDRIVGKSAHAVRKWKNPRLRAVANFQESQGDIPIESTTRRNILDFKKWWLDRIVAEGVNAATANKDFFHLKDVLRVVAAHHEINLNIAVLFAEIKFEAKEASRAPFPTDFIQNNILKPGALDDLNKEARAVVYMMADTGAGPLELIGMLPGEDIVLDAPIPYIWIRPNKNRTLKTESRPRQIPLVGAALYGARLVAGGFTRYTNADSLSNLVNQYFRNKDWQLTPKHSLYSLRHSFKDRLRDIDAPDSLMDELMGHSSGKKFKYGGGYTIEKKKEWLDKIAFKVTATS